MKIAFVTPRYGPGVLGGSEAFMAEAADGFTTRGHDVEVLTTCALDHYTWDNVLPAGFANGVRRFETVRHHSRAALLAQIAVQHGRQVSLDDQVAWLSFQFSSPGLFHHLARHGSCYDFVVFSPYLFWSTVACLPVVAERAVVAPCLHDEPYARVPVLRPVFSSPRRIWFLSEPEHQLAHQIWPLAPHSVTGAGMKVPGNYDPDGFRARHALEKPFLLFAGRREEGKGSSWLGPALRCLPSGWELVTIGKSDKGPLPGTRDLGYLEETERDNAFAAASAYFQPSSMESFSRTIMEAWLAGTPVVAYEGSEVVAWHVRRSGGGALFGSEASLGEALGSIGPGMGHAGRRYVLDNYTWPRVLDRMEASLR